LNVVLQSKAVVAPNLAYLPKRMLRPKRMLHIVVSADLDNPGGHPDHPCHHTSTRLLRRHEHADHLTGGHAMTKYLHTMIRVSSLEDSIAFFEVLGLREIRRRPDEKGRYTNVFLAAPGDEAAAVELTYNWDPEPYTGGRNFGHLAYAVDNIYDTCNAFIARGVTINRPPRDGRMAFIRTPDGISIELLQAGSALPPAEPWTGMANTGSW
jgi:lactoylglutathione lyase